MGQRIARPLTEADLDARAKALGLNARSACTHRCHQGRACTCEPPQPIARPLIVPDEMACTAGTDDNPPRRGLLREFWAFLTARRPYLKR